MYLFFLYVSFQQITVYYNLPSNHFNGLILNIWAKEEILLSIDSGLFWVLTWRNFDNKKCWKQLCTIFKRSTTCILIELQFQILWYLKIRCHNVQNKSAPRGCYSIWIFIAKSGKKCTDLYRGHWLPIETIDNNESHELWDSFLFKTPTVQWTIADKVIVCKSRGELSLLVKYTHSGRHKIVVSGNWNFIKNRSQGWF